MKKKTIREIYFLVSVKFMNAFINKYRTIFKFRQELQLIEFVLLLFEAMQ